VLGHYGAIFFTINKQNSFGILTVTVSFTVGISSGGNRQ
jgi:hypothetical protein